MPAMSVRAMSVRAIIDTSSATPSVSDWLFFLGRGGFLHIKLEAKDQRRRLFLIIIINFFIDHFNQ